MGFSAGNSGSSIFGGALGLYAASQGNSNPKSMPLLDKRTKQLKKATFAEVDSQYQLAQQGGWTVNLAAPIIAGLKAQAEQMRQTEMASVMARGARDANTTDYAAGSSLTRIMADSSQNNITGALAPIDARNKAMRTNYEQAMQHGQSVYNTERKAMGLQQQASLGKFLNHAQRSAAMAQAWGGMAGNAMGAGFGG